MSTSYQTTIYRWRHVEFTHICRACGAEFVTRQRYTQRQRPACSQECAARLKAEYRDRRRGKSE